MKGRYSRYERNFRNNNSKFSWRKISCTNRRKADEKSILFVVKVADKDMGKVIGKEGRVAKSVRTVMKAVAGKERKKVSIEFAE